MNSGNFIVLKYYSIITELEANSFVILFDFFFHKRSQDRFTSLLSEGRHFGRYFQNLLMTTRFLRLLSKGRCFPCGGNVFTLLTFVLVI